mmetsp:Transcript_9034/g.37254  ORF Transcript_9034/g.37254 Transcript_9034/m.37254 type:complete len:213 (+) Transcript_9034:118-756(+)
MYSDGMYLLSQAQQYAEGLRMWTTMQWKAALTAAEALEHVLTNPRMEELADGSLKAVRHPKDLSTRIPEVQTLLGRFRDAVREAEARMETMADAQPHGSEEVWVTLPPELMVDIFSWLPLGSLVAVASVCKAWRIVAYDPSLYFRYYQRYHPDAQYSPSVNWRDRLVVERERLVSSGLLINSSSNVEWAASRSGKGRPVTPLQAMDYLITRF